MNLKISAIELKDIFVSSFSNEQEFKYKEGNPFLIYYERKHYYVFLKNISPAYYPKYPDITRVQLPFSSHFKKISKSSIPFIILGYESEYKTFSAWDPRLIKSRLNAKSNVSLFSRNSFQEKLRLNVFKEHNISNGDKVIVFSFKSLPNFFRNYISLFENSLEMTKVKFVKKVSEDKKPKTLANETIVRINDIAILKEVYKFKLKNDLIGAVIFCIDNYSNQYPGMNLAKWTVLINKVFQNKEIYLIK
jgi:hypothetical protein